MLLLYLMIKVRWWNMKSVLIPYKVERTALGYIPKGLIEFTKCLGYQMLLYKSPERMLIMLK